MSGTYPAPHFASVTLDTPLTVSGGGTGSSSASTARTNLGAAASGANSDITSLSGLTTALSIAQGGTGVSSVSGVAGAISAAYYVGTVADLRALTSATTATTCNVAGYNTAADGGGGIFVVDAADTTSADNGGTIIVDAAGRRWYRVYGGAISVKWFGAKGDGITDDTTAIQNTIASLPDGTIYFPVGTYLVSSQINITGSAILLGEGKPEILMSGAFTLFNVSGREAEIKELFLNGTRTTGQIGISISGPEVVVSNCRIEMMDIGVEVTSGWHHLLDNLWLRNIVTTAVLLSNGVGTRVRDCSYDTDGSWYPGGTYLQPTNGGIYTEQQGTIVEGCDFIHAGNGLVINQTSASPNYFMLITDSYFDSNIGGSGIHIMNNYSGSGTFGTEQIGIFFDGVWSATGLRGLLIDGDYGCNGIYFNSCYFHNNENEGIRIDTTSTSNNIKFSDCIIAGNNVSAGVANSIYANNLNGLQIANCRIGKEFWTTNPDVYYHIYLDTGVVDTGCIISDNICDNGTTQGGLLNNSGNAVVFNNNVGLNAAALTVIEPINIAWPIDASNASFNLGGSATVNLLVGSGLLLLDDLATGDVALVLLGNNSVVVVSQSSGSTWVASSTPTSSQIGIYYNAGAATYSIVNGSSSSRQISGGGIKVRNAT